MATQQEVADRTDLSIRQVQRLIKSGVLPKPRGSGGYDLDACNHAYINYLRNMISPKKLGEDDDDEGDLDLLDLEQERAKNLQVDTRIKELKEQQIRRETAPIALIEWTLGKVGSQIGSILDGIPLKVKRRIPKLSAAEIEVIKREVVQAQNVAARIAVNLDEYESEHQGD